MVFLSVLKMIGELKTTLNEKELPKLWISPTWPSMLVSQKDKKFFQEILDAEMKALYLLECDTVSMKDFNTRLANPYTPFCLFWMLGLVNTKRFEEMEGECSCGSPIVIRRKDTASNVRFECRAKCGRGMFSESPFLKVPCLMSDNAAAAYLKGEGMERVHDFSWESKLRILWGLCLNIGSQKQQKANETKLRKDASPSVVEAYMDDLAKKVGLERHTISKIVNKVKEAIAHGRYQHFFENKLEGSIEADETYSSTQHRADCFTRLLAGMSLELLGMRQSNQGTGKNVPSRDRRTIFCAMLYKDDDSLETRAENIIRLLLTYVAMSTDECVTQLFSDGLKAYPKAAAYLMALYEVVFHKREMVAKIKKNNSQTIEKANDLLKAYACRRYRADWRAMEREAMFLDYYYQYEGCIWQGLLYAIVFITEVYDGRVPEPPHWTPQPLPPMTEEQARLYKEYLKKYEDERCTSIYINELQKEMNKLEKDLREYFESAAAEEREADERAAEERVANGNRVPAYDFDSDELIETVHRVVYGQERMEAGEARGQVGEMDMEGAAESIVYEYVMEEDDGTQVGGVDESAAADSVVYEYVLQDEGHEQVGGMDMGGAADSTVYEYVIEDDGHEQVGGSEMGGAAESTVYEYVIEDDDGTRESFVCEGGAQGQEGVEGMEA